MFLHSTHSTHSFLFFFFQCLSLPCLLVSWTKLSFNHPGSRWVALRRVKVIWRQWSSLANLGWAVSVFAIHNQRECEIRLRHASGASAQAQSLCLPRCPTNSVQFVSLLWRSICLEPLWLATRPLTESSEAWLKFSMCNTKRRETQVQPVGVQWKLMYKKKEQKLEGLKATKSGFWPFAPRNFRVTRSNFWWQKGSGVLLLKQMKFGLAQKCFDLWGYSRWSATGVPAVWPARQGKAAQRHGIGALGLIPSLHCINLAPFTFLESSLQSPVVCCFSASNMLNPLLSNEVCRLWPSMVLHDPVTGHWNLWRTSWDAGQATHCPCVVGNS